MAHVVCVIDGGVVDHRGDDQVDVHPQGVVKHEPDEGKETEDIAHREPTGACGKLHLVDSLTVDNVLITSNYSNLQRISLSADSDWNVFYYLTHMNRVNTLDIQNTTV